jgi:acetyltransferase-like isoleucine patch superfamily enzyme
LRELVIGKLNLDMKRIKRIFLLPFGFVKKILEIANEGARDIENSFRFKNAIVDKGCSIDPKSIIHQNVRLQNNCIVNNSQINSYTYLGKNCLVQNTSIGKFCSIANDVLIGLGNHPLDLLSTSPLFYKTINALEINLIKEDKGTIEYLPIEIGNDVWIGTRSIILDGVTIGHGAVIAANSVVTKDVSPYAIVGGVPAKIIKYRFEANEIKELIESKWWDMKLIEINRRNNLFNQSE